LVAGGAQETKSSTITIHMNKHEQTQRFPNALQISVITSLVIILAFVSFKPDDPKPQCSAIKTQYNAEPKWAEYIETLKDEKDKQIVFYCKKYKQAAQDQYHKYQIPTAITLAQGILESKAGCSKLAKATHNHFGIKCFSRNCKKGHCKNFSDDSHKDFFMCYPSGEKSFEAHSKFLLRPHYKSLFKNTVIWDWCKGLKQLGYATDPEYDIKLVEIIQRYKLYLL
jgi:flagellum-specific peptidoglycan hydrolase FlgJ